MSSSSGLDAAYLPSEKELRRADLQPKAQIAVADDVVMVQPKYQDIIPNSIYAQIPPD